MFSTLISTQEFYAHLNDPDWAVVDCRFTLGDSQRGRQDYLLSHIPGAVYAHLENDLCASPIPGVTGRHPLPSVESLADKFSQWGIASGVQVIIYDDWPGVGLAAAARLWWSLKWLGHAAVAVLDGGWTHWQAQGFPVYPGEETRPPHRFIPEVCSDLLVSSDDVEQMLKDTRYRVFDSRSTDRYNGENETIDPVTGHIPGAISAPYLENFTPAGLFRPVQELNERFQALLGDVPGAETAFYCGSGITAAHNVLALAHAGLGEARLYVGSWSEWITDPNRPVAK